MSPSILKTKNYSHNYLQLQEGFNVYHVHIVKFSWWVSMVSIGVRMKCFCIYHSFIKHQTILFCAWTYTETLSDWVAGKKGWVRNIYFAALI